MPTTSPIDAKTLHVALLEHLTTVVAVPAATLEPVLCALLAGGHVLLDGIPGIGKTLLARAVASASGGDFRRVQFTNDLMPSDVVGTAVWRPDRGRFSFVPGPLFANLVLADEINRSSPRTLSCLLEAMESGKVSVEGRTLALGDPFTVIATRNPIEFHGTYPLPEAVLDRFLVRVELGYPTAAAERDLYLGSDPETRLALAQPILSREDLQHLRAQVPLVRVGEPVADYVYAVVAATRTLPGLQLGASPRAAMSWLRCARARALLHGRDYVLPDDLKALAQPALAHRLFAAPGFDVAGALQELLANTPVPL